MAAAADERARQEDDVLADLIQHHWQNSNVLDWLPADAFTAGPRRDVYEAIAALGRSRRSRSTSSPWHGTWPARPRRQPGDTRARPQPVHGL